MARSWVGGFVLAVVLVSAGTATAAGGGILRLGHANSAHKSTTLRNTGKGPALKLSTTSAKTPNLSVSNKAMIRRLNADAVDGLEGSGLGRRVRLFDADGTYVVPAGVHWLRVELWGGGGTGQEAFGGHGGPGGGAGGYLEGLLSVTPGMSCTVTVGAGGTWTDGLPDGGDTSIDCGGQSATAPGGQGGSDSTNAGGAGGDPGPFGVKGQDGAPGTPGQGGAGGIQAGGGDTGCLACGGSGGNNPGDLLSKSGGPGIAVIQPY
jgi:hypothetical protein